VPRPKSRITQKGPESEGYCSNHEAWIRAGAHNHESGRDYILRLAHRFLAKAEIMCVSIHKRGEMKSEGGPNQKPLPQTCPGAVSRGKMSLKKEDGKDKPLQLLGATKRCVIDTVRKVAGSPLLGFVGKTPPLLLTGWGDYDRAGLTKHTSHKARSLTPRGTLPRKPDNLHRGPDIRHRVGAVGKEAL